MKKICIIGAASGIGKALHEYYLAQGNQVVGIGRQDLDLQDISAVNSFAQKLKDAEYDLVIFTAGVGYHREFFELTSEEITEQMLVNSLAPMQIVKSLKPESKFVYISSIIQCIPAKNMPVYAASKNAMIQLLTAVRDDASSPEILCVMLGAVKTQMHIKAGLEEKVGREIERVLPKLVKRIETSQGNKTLFWDWWIMIYIVFPLYRLFLNIK